jgi:uncharacterized membrane protein
MDWYTLFKFLHVLTAIIWIGGAFIMLTFGINAVRQKNDVQLVAVAAQMGWAAERIYVPASAATVVLGIVVATIGQLWTETWVILGLVGMVITMALGILALTPRAKKVAAASEPSPEAVTVARELVTLVKFDCAALFVVVADMVLKPASSDWIVLVIMTVVVIGAAAVWLLPTLRSRTSAA